MLRRYVLPCALIMFVSLGVAGLAYKGAAAKEFTTNCSFQAVIRLSAQIPLNDEGVKQYNAASNLAVAVAQETTLYPDAAKALKVTPQELASSISVTVPPYGGIGTYAVVARNADPKRAVTFANAVCQQFVTTVQKQRATKTDAEIKAAEAKLKTLDAELRKLLAIPKKKRTSTDLANILAKGIARKGTIGQLTFLLGLPPDNISVLTTAKGAHKIEKRSLSKNLIIALMAGLFASFAMVLAGETFIESRKRASV